MMKKVTIVHCTTADGIHLHNSINSCNLTYFLIQFRFPDFNFNLNLDSKSFDAGLVFFPVNFTVCSGMITMVTVMPISYIGTVWEPIPSK